MGDTGDGYRIRSKRTWAAAWRDYLADDAAEACTRYNLKLETLRHLGPRTARAETAPPDLAAMARHALARLDRAVRRGRAAEAASLLRTWRALTDPALLAAAAPEPEPAPLHLEQELNAVAAGALSPHDHAAVEASLTALRARLDPQGGGPISDDSNYSDGVFLEEAAPHPSPSPLEGEGL